MGYEQLSFKDKEGLDSPELYLKGGNWQTGYMVSAVMEVAMSTDKAGQD